MFLKFLLTLSNTLISDVLITTLLHMLLDPWFLLSLIGSSAQLHELCDHRFFLCIIRVLNLPVCDLKQTAVSESVTFTIQDSESGPEVSVETIRFACCKGPHFSGKRLPSKIFPNLDGDHKMLVFRFRLPEPPLDFTKFFVQMLVKNSAHRLPLHKVLEHPWIVQNADPSGVYRG